MTSFVHYIPDKTAFKNLEDRPRYKQRFYHTSAYSLSGHGEGKSQPINIVSPTEDAVLRAKAELTSKRKQFCEHTTTKPKKRKKKVVVHKPIEKKSKNKRQKYKKK